MSAGVDLPTAPEAAWIGLLQAEHRKERDFMRLLAQWHLRKQASGFAYSIASQPLPQLRTHSRTAMGRA